jgi:hydroxymethylglutaryl-CoA lyase
MARAAPTVRIVEVGPRDGLQNIDKILPTGLKIELIKRLASTGLQVIEATSFVSPKWIPQLADGAEVMKAIKPLINSNTEGFSQKNQNCSVAQALTRAREVAERAIPLGIQVRG